AALAGVTRPPSRLPLFPYTTLFRSEGVDVGPRQLGDAAQDALLLGHGVALVVGAARLFQTTVAGATAGSEAPAPAAETAAPAEAAPTPAEAAAPAEAAPAPAAVPAPAAEEDAAEGPGADVDTPPDPHQRAPP